MKMIPNLSKFILDTGFNYYFPERGKYVDKSLKVNVNNIDRIDIVAGGNHGQGLFQFPVKVIYVMDDEEICKRIKKRL